MGIALKSEPKIHAGHVEVAVANLLNYRVYTIVPNVSWGFGLRHECDMLASSDNGYLTEVEIKVTMSDLKADFKKKHGHSSKIISRLVYAMPEKMIEKALPLIPEKCGIIGVRLSGSMTFVAYWVRRATRSHDGKPSDSQIKELMRLGCMRIWSLKQHNYKKSNA